MIWMSAILIFATNMSSCSNKPEEDDVIDQPIVRETPDSMVTDFFGTVKDQNGRPVVGASVSAYAYRDNREYSAQTNAKGCYFLSVEQCNTGYGLKISKPGFATYLGRISFDPLSEVINNGSPDLATVVLYSQVDYAAGHRATIILPEPPDPSWGRFYRMDRIEDYHLVFEREKAPKANVPYVIFPEKNFSIYISDYDLTQVASNVINVYVYGKPEETNRGAIFRGTYVSQDMGDTKECDYAISLDDTPDCKDEACIQRTGAFHAIIVSPFNNPSRIVFTE